MEVLFEARQKAAAEEKKEEGSRNILAKNKFLVLILANSKMINRFARS